MTTESDPLICYFDGLCEDKNPGGHMCGGFVIVDHPFVSGFAGHAYYGTGPDATNNRAEYEAALSILRLVYRSGYRGPIILRGDSKLVVEQFAGRWKCNVEALQKLLVQLRRAASFFESVTLEWIPRAQNQAADEQSRLAYRAILRGAA